MGERSRWVAIRGKPQSEVISDLGLRRIGKPSGDESECCLIIARDDWFVVLDETVTEAKAKKLSDGAESVFFSSETWAMTTELSVYADGKEQWSVLYSGDDGVSEPEVYGDEPTFVQRLIQECRDDQAGEGEGESDIIGDYMHDATARVGFALVGYRDGEFPDVPDTKPYQKLEDIRTQNSTCESERKMLLVSGRPPLVGPSRSQVLSSIKNIQYLMPCTVQLVFGLIETRRTKRLEIKVTRSATGLSCESHSPDGRLNAFRRDEAPLTVADVQEIFDSYYEKGQRSPDFHWTL